MAESILERPHGRADTKLIERAIKMGWNIPEDIKPALLQRQIDIATSSECSPRECTSAFNAILSADRIDQAERFHNESMKTGNGAVFQNNVQIVNQRPPTIQEVIQAAIAENNPKLYQEEDAGLPD